MKVTLVPVICCSSRPVICAAAFWLTNFASPGLAFIQATSSLSLLAGRFFLATMKLRIDRDQPDRLEVLLQVVVDVVDDAADVGIPLADVDGVAVRRRARDAADRDAAAGAADVLDDDRLAEDRPHLLGHDARDDIGRAARRERHHQRDLLATERSAPARPRGRPARPAPRLRTISSCSPPGETQMLLNGDRRYWTLMPAP